MRREPPKPFFSARHDDRMPPWGDLVLEVTIEPIKRRWWHWGMDGEEVFSWLVTRSGFVSVDEGVENTYEDAQLAAENAAASYRKMCEENERRIMESFTTYEV